MLFLLLIYDKLYITFLYSLLLYNFNLYLKILLIFLLLNQSHMIEEYIKKTTCNWICEK